MEAVPDRDTAGDPVYAGVLRRRDEWLGAWRAACRDEATAGAPAPDPATRAVLEDEVGRLASLGAAAPERARARAFEETAEAALTRGVGLAELLLASGLLSGAAARLAEGPGAAQALASLRAIDHARVTAYARVYREARPAPPPARCASGRLPVLARRAEAPETWGIVGESAPIVALRAAIAAASTGPRNVLVVGESGSGKELVARAIHRAAGGERDRFVAVNCAALPSHLVESELFGHVRGAFTGAAGEYAGLFRAANGGTLFLDELTEMGPEVQAKLLRVLEERTVRPVGGLRELPVDVRIVASTNRPLEGALADGRLRRDLYYRLQSFTLAVPPLRERRGDVPLLAEHFLTTYCHRRCGCIWGISEGALALLDRAEWPGNVRELRNAVEHAVTTGSDGVIEVKDLPAYLRDGAPMDGGVAWQRQPDALPTLAESEDDLIRRTVERCGGNKLRAAQSLGISRNKLYDRLRKLGLA
ncbi:MAG: sigma 54-interacting transcriptional regulator [Polyangiaceae bacterium]|nr:sigma 54-interacting transcriptional regulator [Polyangiaceae bacterium]